MIKTEPQPKQKRKHSQPEHKLQAELVKEFNHRYPKRYGELFATFQETLSNGQGGVMLSLGLVAGVADLQLLNNGVLTGIEVKAIGTRHDRLHLIRQARWLLKVPKVGYFCDNLEMFLSIIEGGEGLSPQKVLNYCLNSNNLTITWSRELFF